MTVAFTVTIDTSKADQVLTRFGRALEPRPLLSLIGLRFLAWINQNFREGGAEQKWVPLSPNTIAGRRGGGAGAQPLRDTGRLAQSFTSEMIGADTVWVGTRDQKAQWHHFGTRPHDIVAKRAKTLLFHTPQGIVFRRKVHHPGTPVRPLLPTIALAERLAQGVADAYLAELQTRRT